MFETRAVYKPERQRVYLYVFDPQARKAMIRKGDDIEIIDADPGAELPVYMSLTEEEATRILAALEAEAYKIPEPATRAHLNDAVKVRDRLLTLVEKLVPES